MTTNVAYLNLARWPRPVALLQGLLRELRNWHERRLAVAQLRSLPDHLLEDIGIARANIRNAVDGELLRRG